MITGPTPRGRNFGPASDQAAVEQAIFTALCELPPDTHPDDILDCVCGQLPWDDFKANEAYIVKRIAQLS